MVEHAGTPWLSGAELRALGFRQLGRDVKVSRRASIHQAASISLGDAVRIDDFCVLTGGGGLIIGNFVHVACFCGLFGGSGITIGDFSQLSGRVAIYSESDDFSGLSMTNPTVPDRYRTTLKKGRVELGRHALVGAGSTLLPGVVLEDGAAVGAHSLVTRRCEAWWIYVGVPVRKLRRRSRKLLEQESELLKSLDGLAAP
jgi:galactoside O-acetyltransferase